MRGASQSLTLEPSDLGAQEPPSGPEVSLWTAAPPVSVVQGSWDRTLDLPFPICVEVAFCGMQCLWG